MRALEVVHFEGPILRHPLMATQKSQPCEAVIVAQPNRLEPLRLIAEFETLEDEVFPWP